MTSVTFIFIISMDELQRFTSVFAGNKRLGTVGHSVDEETNFFFQGMMTANFDIILLYF